jgi:tRNA threonylcarbamoyladenosine biosynthesis protein TsaB
LGHCSAGLVVDDVCLREQHSDGGRGHGGLAAMAESVMAGGVDLVAVTVGPGSFTGLRAAIALAHGIALGAGVKVVGVTVAEALADALPDVGRRALWVAVDSRRNRVFLQRGLGPMTSMAVDEIGAPEGCVALAGDAAVTVGARLAALGHDVMLTSARYPMPRHIAMVGRARAMLPPVPVRPLYVDPPEAKQTLQRPPPVE